MTSILFNITHGFQARMLLRSTITDKLLEAGAKLVICSPNADEVYFRREFERPGITLERMPQTTSRIERNVMSVRQILLMNPSLGSTYNYKQELLRKQMPTRYRVVRAANSVFGRLPIVRTAYFAAEKRLFAGREYDSLLTRHRPDLIVTGTPGFVVPDAHLLRSAQRLRTPTATVMLSWDNLSSKGYMNGTPDHLLVWSDLMAKEATTYHEYPPERITWVGAAQFDHYVGFRERFDRLAWRRRHGIADGATLIVYGTINPALAPHEPAIVREIVDSMRGGKFGRPVHLWIRLHPQVMRGVYSTSLDPYREMAGADVTVEEPRVQSESLAWDLPREDAEHLASLLTAADIVTTPCSTLVIDAASVDTPIINVFFDGRSPFDPTLSVRRFANYTHYRAMLETGGPSIAYSIEEFIQAATAYSQDRTFHSAGRAALVRQQFNCLDGQAGERTANELLRLARHRVPAPTVSATI